MDNNHNPTRLFPVVTRTEVDLMVHIPLTVQLMICGKNEHFLNESFLNVSSTWENTFFTPISSPSGILIYIPGMGLGLCPYTLGTFYFLSMNYWKVVLWLRFCTSFTNTSLLSSPSSSEMISEDDQQHGVLMGQNETRHKASGASPVCPGHSTHISCQSSERFSWSLPKELLFIFVNGCLNDNSQILKGDNSRALSVSLFKKKSLRFNKISPNPQSIPSGWGGTQHCPWLT